MRAELKVRMNKVILKGKPDHFNVSVSVARTLHACCIIYSLQYHMSTSSIHLMITMSYICYMRSRQCTCILDVHHLLSIS